MTQWLIYGKTIKIEGDVINFDGVTFMDPYDDSGAIPPMDFSNTAQLGQVTAINGGNAAYSLQLLFTRNNNRCRIELSATGATLGVVPTGTTLTLTVPVGFRPLANITLLIPMYNITTTTNIFTNCTLDTAGLLTFTGLTSGSNYNFRMT